jgi:hypothetical protein
MGKRCSGFHVPPWGRGILSLMNYPGGEGSAGEKRAEGQTDFSPRPFQFPSVKILSI